MRLLKTDFIHYLRCPNSLWLQKHKPDAFPKGEFSAFASKIATEGREVEWLVEEYLNAQADAGQYEFQVELKSADGLQARADVIRKNDGGTIDLYEVKSSTGVKQDSKHHHIKGIPPVRAVFSVDLEFRTRCWYEQQQIQTPHRSCVSRRNPASALV